MIEGLWNRRSDGSGGRVKRTKNPNMYSVRDVEIMDEKEVDDLDEILDKISKKGYDALTKDEKNDFLN
jgi:hypothetical protein